MTLRLFLAALLGVFGIQNLFAQEPQADSGRRFLLVQVVETATLEQKIQEAAGDGYCLDQLTIAGNGTLAAILEKTTSPPSCQYVFREIKITGKIFGDLAEQISQNAAQGFHLHTIVTPSPYLHALHLPDVLLLMEKQTGSINQSVYELLSPTMGGLGGFDQKKIGSLINQGYTLVQTAWLLKPVLIYEKNSESPDTGAPGTTAPPPNPWKGYKFLISRWSYNTFPDKELLKEVDQGSRAVAVFPMSEYVVTAAVEKIPDTSKPYEYQVLKPRPLNSGVFTAPKFSPITEDDLNQAGAKGFRLFRQNVMFIPYLMEKPPGELMPFQYRLLEGANLAELSEKLEEGGGQGYRVVAMSGMQPEAGMIVVMEKPAVGEAK